DQITDSGKNDRENARAYFNTGKRLLLQPLYESLRGVYGFSIKGLKAGNENSHVYSNTLRFRRRNRPSLPARSSIHGHGFTHAGRLSRVDRRHLVLRLLRPVCTKILLG